ncbi:hypothetical protein T265_04812 [Opisthorchis viverrini]|uniref:Bacterial surface antigen (D15) domain-containing protein n=1 Tax=Opisthorchis viverrini TaxID=6198 RepID=A0A074ZYF4_OPIVI|nr:hypothetical protein T265_04812 [Opisthorchis viverrini]KER28355.1 hypothetical protein T265_04812 [Opisthorchis viverrini]
MSSFEVVHTHEIPAFVDKIIVSGLNRTEESLIKKQALVQSTNVKDLFERVSEAKKRLDKLGVFRYVYALVDVAEEPSKYRVIFKVEEKRPATGRISLTHGTDGVSKMCGSVRLNNLLRGAEFADLDLEVGSNQLTTKVATLSKPLERNPYVRFSFGGTEGHWDHWWARFLRHERSVFSDVAVETAYGVHKFQWDANWREVEARDNTTPWAVRKESGAALKVGLKHTFEHDTRSDMVFPDSGFLFRLSKELATISPGSPTGQMAPDKVTSPSVARPSDDRAFQLKVEGLAHKPFRLTDWLVGEVTCSAGLTHSLSRHPIHIVDRFFLGGPLELRGFQWRTVSPMQPLLEPTPFNLPTADVVNETVDTTQTSTASRSPVGSDGFWLTGAHFYTPLPFFGAEEGSLASHFRLHAFCLAGSTLDSPVQRVLDSIAASTSDQTSLARRLLTELSSQPRAVVGGGLVIRFAGLLRIEINYCVPFKSQPGDLLKSGFNFGFGIAYS